METATDGGDSSSVTEATAPPFWRTYALSYAIGALLLAAEILVLGTQPKYGFGGVYTAAFALPPMLAAAGLLLVDRPGRARTLPLRALALAVTAGLVSVLSTVLLTPFLVLMFREGVGHSLSATGMLSAVSLVVVAVPLVIELWPSGRSGRWLHVALLMAGVTVVGVALSMALAPTGALASSMRLDQGELLMITSSWWLPVYALTVAYARRIGMA
jgi:MFS family permease